MKNVIYYFTGTGNSMRAAEKIAATLRDTEIVSMRCNPDDVPATHADVIGFIYPVYHWTMPEPVVQFIHALSINTKAYIFVVSMPSFINGYACEKLEKLLHSKGARVSYGNKVHGVANYVINYPPIPPAKLTVPRTERKLAHIAQEIAHRRERPIPRAGFVVQRRFPKVMPRYRELQPYADTGFLIRESCISCGMCEKLCPCRNIELVEGKPTFRHECTQCMACVCFCPQRAIDYKIPAPELLSNSLLDRVLVKKMSLPPKRRIYTNPYVSAGDIMKDKKTIQ